MFLTGLWFLSKPFTILNHGEKDFRHNNFLIVMIVMRTEMAVLTQTSL